MMKETERKAAAKAFAEKWAGHGNEKSETQIFWRSLLQDVYGVEHVEDFVKFEIPVKISHTVAEGKKTTTRYIDVMIPSTRIVIEQKSSGIDLKKPSSQSGGDNLTAFEQAKRYADFLPDSRHPRWIVACNFSEFHIHDMEKPTAPPQIVMLESLPQEYNRLLFLVKPEADVKPPEEKVSLDAGNIVARLKTALEKQYIDPESRHAKESLNKLCVRLVFCLYAEDAGVFDVRNMFHDYLKSFQPQNVRLALIELFKALATPEEKRDPYMDERLAAFPYVNGGLFEDENIEIPSFNDEILDILLNHASADFDWSQISPPIFGALFESTLSGDVRRAGGMHYTSIENIHKVIDPLFLNDLNAEFAAIKTGKQPNVKRKNLLAFQKKLASLVFLDPAAGSGNFLTETYLSLRRMENEILKELLAIRASADKDKGEKSAFLYLTGGDDAPIQVSIRQFYGIEINGYAVAVAQTALWIAESQMLTQTEEAIGEDLDFLPLKNNPNIIEGNALTLDWESVVPKGKLDYIMGNPPFVGASMMTMEQKTEAVAVFGKGKRVNSIDYVGAWYHKAAAYIASLSEGGGARSATEGASQTCGATPPTAFGGPPSSKRRAIKAAFVSTNSITQGEQVAALWKKLLEVYKIHIDFAWRTFRWNSESTQKAAVHCVIIGFSSTDTQKHKILYAGDGAFSIAKNINPYLIDAADVLMETRPAPLCDVPPITYGNKPSDGGNLLLSEDERNALLKKSPELAPYVRRYVGAKDFINNDQVRYCLWLKDASPSLYRKNIEVMQRLNAVREMREKSSAAPTKAMAETPYLFFSAPQTDNDYLCIPEVSSERRRYIPVALMSKDIIAANTVLIVPNATLYHFGIVVSHVHNAWVRAIAGRLKSDYRYSGSVVYNNFPWPTPSDAQKTKIEETAEAILDAREKFPDASLADLYDETAMPPELRKAHEANDKAVMQAYGFKPRMTEPEIVAELMKRYQRLAERRDKKR